MNFKILLGGVMTLFIAILIFCYIVVAKTNPVFLDEHGKPQTTTQPAN